MLREMERVSLRLVGGGRPSTKGTLKGLIAHMKEISSEQRSRMTRDSQDDLAVQIRQQAVDDAPQLPAVSPTEDDAASTEEEVVQATADRAMDACAYNALARMVAEYDAVNRARSNGQCMEVPLREAHPEWCDALKLATYTYISEVSGADKLVTAHHYEIACAMTALHQECDQSTEDCITREVVQVATTSQRASAGMIREIVVRLAAPTRNIGGWEPEPYITEATAISILTEAAYTSEYEGEHVEAVKAAAAQTIWAKKSPGKDIQTVQEWVATLKGMARTPVDAVTDIKVPKSIRQHLDETMREADPSMRGDKEQMATQAIQKCVAIMATALVGSIQKDTGSAVETIVKNMRMPLPRREDEEAQAGSAPAAKARRPTADELHTVASQIDDPDLQTEAYTYLTVVVRGMALTGMPTKGDEENILEKCAARISEWRPLKAGRQASNPEAISRHEKLDSLLAGYATEHFLSSFAQPPSQQTPDMRSLEDAGQGHLAAAKAIMTTVASGEPGHPMDPMHVLLPDRVMKYLKPLAKLMRDAIRTPPTPTKNTRFHHSSDGAVHLAFQLFGAPALEQSQQGAAPPRVQEGPTSTEYLVADTLWGLGVAHLMMSGCDSVQAVDAMRELTSPKPSNLSPEEQTPEVASLTSGAQRRRSSAIQDPLQEMPPPPEVKSELGIAQDEGQGSQPMSPGGHHRHDFAEARASQPAAPPDTRRPVNMVKIEGEAREAPRVPAPDPREYSEGPSADEHGVRGGQPAGPAGTGRGEHRPLQRGLVNMGGVDNRGVAMLTPITLIKQNPSTQFWHVVMHTARDLRMISLDPGSITVDDPSSHMARTGLGDMGGYQIPIVLLRHDAARDEWTTVAYTADCPSMMTFKSADVTEDGRPAYRHPQERAQGHPHAQNHHMHYREGEGMSFGHHPQRLHEGGYERPRADPRAPHPSMAAAEYGYGNGSEVGRGSPQHDLPSFSRDSYASQRGYEEPAARMRPPTPPAAPLPQDMYLSDWHGHGGEGAQHGGRGYGDRDGDRYSYDEERYQQADRRLERRPEGRSSPLTWSPDQHDGRGGRDGRDGSAYSRSHGSPQHSQRRSHPRSLEVGKLQLGRHNDRRHAATTRTEGLGTASWDKLKEGIKEVKPAAGILLEDQGGLEQFIMDMATKVCRDKLSSSTPATIMAIIGALDEHSRSSNFTPSQKDIIYAASMKAAQVTNLDVMRYEWTDSKVSSMDDPESVELYTVEQLAALLEASRIGNRFTSNTSAVMRFAQAVQWRQGVPSEEALLRLLQDTHQWLRQNPRFTHDSQIGERFGEKVSTSLEPELTMAKHEGSGAWEGHLTAYYQTIKGPARYNDDTLQWVRDITEAAKRFTTLSAQEQYQHRDRRGAPRRNVISGGSDGDRGDTDETAEEELRKQMKAVIEHTQVCSLLTPPADGDPVCGFCQKKHDGKACFLWLTDDPGSNYVFLYFRVLRTNRRFLEQVCQHGISRATVRGSNPPLGAIISGSRGTGPLADSPRDGDHPNTLRWREEHVKQAEDYMARPEWRDIPKCNGECCVRAKMGSDWSWNDARSHGRPDRCTAITELNDRINQQNAVAASAGRRGPLRNAAPATVYALCNISTTGETKMALDSLCMARDEMDAPIRGEDAVSHTEAGRTSPLQ
jgi:hypothetical protein